ncbi:MAG: AtpZ/AtpI family protein [Nitrospira sp.]|nr:AtpZ/AtpI family protein [Nitrospira sp.]MDR4462953.1 AtpZ/AtpI family protein [Nitrospira sp.]MDR4467605.1 AtpZ/AtpI family protein [Nitrospira sp.]
MSLADNKLKERISRQTRRMKQAERDRPTLLGQTVYVGTLGLLMVIPIVVGAYVGQWLDSLVEGYSIRWTIGFILIGVVIGAVNIYLFVKE